MADGRASRPAALAGRGRTPALISHAARVIVWRKAFPDVDAALRLLGYRIKAEVPPPVVKDLQGTPAAEGAQAAQTAEADLAAEVMTAIEEQLAAEGPPPEDAAPAQVKGESPAHREPEKAPKGADSEKAHKQKGHPRPFEDRGGGTAESRREAPAPSHPAPSGGGRTIPDRPFRLPIENTNHVIPHVIVPDSLGQEEAARGVPAYTSIPDRVQRVAEGSRLLVETALWRTAFSVVPVRTLRHGFGKKIDIAACVRRLATIEAIDVVPTKAAWQHVPVIFMTELRLALGPYASDIEDLIAAVTTILGRSTFTRMGVRVSGNTVIGGTGPVWTWRAIALGGHRVKVVLVAGGRTWRTDEEVAFQILSRSLIEAGHDVTMLWLGKEEPASGWWRHRWIPIQV